MKKVIVIAPHPDDETLGCGGTILKHIEQGDQVYWVIVTKISVDEGFDFERVESRTKEVQVVSSMYGFANVYQLNWPTMKLDRVPMSELVVSLSAVFVEVSPEIVYIPHRGDIHTDHRYVFDAAVACTKWFRYPFVKKVMVYETLSETELSMSTGDSGFKPNVFVNITPYFDRKWEIMRTFQSEIGQFPFPRSFESIDALCTMRGTTCGYHKAEAFMLLKEAID